MECSALAHPPPSHSPRLPYRGAPRRERNKDTFWFFPCCSLQVIKDSWCLPSILHSSSDSASCGPSNCFWMLWSLPLGQPPRDCHSKMAQAQLCSTPSSPPPQNSGLIKPPVAGKGCHGHYCVFSKPDLLPHPALSPDPSSQRNLGHMSKS